MRHFSLHFAQYWMGLVTGSSDPDTVLPEFRAALAASGYGAIVSTVQEQVDLFEKAKQQG
ncbi:MAG: DUF3502 domain-containing protein [Saccharofermentanales bacterium]